MADLGVAGLAAEFGPEFFGGRDDQRLEMVDGTGPGGDGAGPGADQDAEGFAFAAASRHHRVVAAEGFSGGADGIDAVAFASGCPGRAFGSSDLDYLLTLLGEKRAEPCAVATGPFQGPTTDAGHLDPPELEQGAVAGGA